MGKVKGKAYAVGMRTVLIPLCFAPLALSLAGWALSACNLSAADQARIESAAVDAAQLAACDLLPLADAPPGVDALACQEAAPAVRVALSAALATSPAPTATSPAKKAAKNKSGKVVAVVPAHLHAGVTSALAK